MKKHICLQAGHENTQYNSIKAIRRSTGAPNEMSFNVDIRNQVAGELRARDFKVTTTDANANDDPNITSTDFDLFLSIHYDADIYGEGGGFVDFPDPSVDEATVRSKIISALLEAEYVQTTGIVSKYNRSDPNTRYYYMWKFLTADTPCNIIECGVGMHTPDDHTTLHFNRPLVVEGIVRGICKAFNVDYDKKPEEPIVDECDALRAENTKLRKTNTQLKTERDQARGHNLILAVAIENAKASLDVDVN